MADRARLSVTPGLTCVWQVSGRAEIPFPEQVRMDLDYIREQSLWADIKLLLKTIPAVIKGRGAY
jgi:lipopolysaccharide/colanic/teichoic acid biosynthesis glycosyltransferase